MSKKDLFLVFTVVFQVFLTSNTVFSKRVMDPPPLDYNLEIDKVLSGIEQVVRDQNETQFSTFFSDSFDAKDWYRKFLKQLTADQADTYSLSRFGDVKDGKFAQFTESIRLNETTTRRTPFDAVFTEIFSESGQKSLVIDSLTVHDGKGADDEN